ncbi:TetR/AcrR family transcriptional regulator [Streptomyces sp. NPDC101151]|uniref:TetR/AcrR family transcriptional regulator n=1 Tax=Streptomyces sp. NPDC101151 TaxID=3366115 RepID=UPI003816AB66
MRAARDQFRSVGYNGTSIDDLSAVTDLGTGNLYGAFGDKHALFAAGSRQLQQPRTGAWRTALSGPGPALPMLERHVRNVAESRCRREEAARWRRPAIRSSVYSSKRILPYFWMRSAFD